MSPSTINPDQIVGDVLTDWELTRENLAAIDDRIDEDGIYAKGYWQEVDGSLAVVGLRIGTGETRQIAFYGDRITRHPGGRWTVHPAPRSIPTP